MEKSAIMEILDQHINKRKRGYVYLGSSDNPITTEMLVAGRELKASFELSSKLSQLWVLHLIDKVVAT